MTPPLLSVCSITYNHSQFIAKALDGFLMQKTSFPFEIIINDDCSTDGTAGIIKAYQARYPGRITAIFQNENQHRQGKHVLPIVFSRARGKYIAICEGDDYWTHPDKLQRQVEYLESHPNYGGCFHSVQKETRRKNGEVTRELFAWNEATLTIEALLQENPIATCSVLARRKYLPASLPPRFNGCAMGDWPRWIFIAINAPWANLPDVMATYVVHEKGVWSKLKTTEQLQHAFFMLACMEEEVSSQHRTAAHVGLLRYFSMLAPAWFQTAKTDPPRWALEKIAALESVVDRGKWLAAQGTAVESMARIAVRQDPHRPSRDIVEQIRDYLRQISPGARTDVRVDRMIRAAVAANFCEIGNESHSRGDYAAARQAYGEAMTTSWRNFRTVAYYIMSRLGGFGVTCRNLVRRLSANSIVRIR